MLPFFVRIVLPFVPVLSHDILLILFTLFEITMFVLLIKGGVNIGRDKMQGNLRPSHITEELVKLKMRS